MTAFSRMGMIHRPTSPLGWLITLAAIAFAVQVSVAIDAHAHSVSDMLYGVYPFLGVTFLLWDWLARRLSA
ncbi:MAG: hypothetical protein ACRCSO_00570 [Sphingomonas sp.]